MTIASDRFLKGMRPTGLVGRALRWWLDELRGMFEDSARHLALGRRGQTTIEAGERYWILRRRRQPVGQIDWQRTEPERCREQLSRLIGDGGRQESVSVELPPERVLAKTIRLPAAARGRLDSILGFEVGRQFPFPADRVFYRYRPVADRSSEPAGRTEVAVELVAVPRDAVAAILAEVSAAGFRVSRIAMFTDGNAEPLFLPAALGAAQGGGRRLAMTAVLAAGIASAISWPVAQQWRLASIEREIAALRPRAETVLSERERQRRGTDRAAAILALRGAQPSVLDMLDELSRAVPDGSWLTSLSISGREIVIEGLSTSAAGVVQALERSGGFDKIVFRSPINRDAANGLERFQLGTVTAGGRR